MQKGLNYRKKEALNRKKNSGKGIKTASRSEGVEQRETKVKSKKNKKKDRDPETPSSSK